MPNKYNFFTSNASEESTYQNLVYPRNLACVKQGAISYVVVDSKFVKSDKKLKDCPLFYDDTEFYVMNDDSGKDTWGGVTTTGIYTVDTLITPEKQLVINQTKKEAEQLKEVIDEIDNPPTPSFNITNVYFKLSGQDGVLTAIGDNLPQNAKYSWNIHSANRKPEPLVLQSDGPVLTILDEQHQGYPSQIRDYLNQTAVTITVNGKTFTDIALETQPINIIYSAKETTYTFNTSDIEDDGSEGWWWAFRLYADEDSKEPVAAATVDSQNGASYSSAIINAENQQHQEFVNAANAHPEYIIVVDISSQNGFSVGEIVCHKES